jgi:cysteinyl-tRNA synthetase
VIGGFAVALAAALDADLDTKRALAETERFLRALNELCDHALRKQGKLIRSHLDDAIFGLSSLTGRLGLGASSPDAWLIRVRDRRAVARGLSKVWIESKLRERSAARERKDFAGADAVRAELSALGIEIVDSPSGTSWSL